jgi:hypothetical protein
MVAATNVTDTHAAAMTITTITAQSIMLFGSNVIPFLPAPRGLDLVGLFW